MAPVIIKLNKPRHRQKVAAFDYDWTLVRPKNNRRFPKDADDWQWFRQSVLHVLKRYYDEGYGIFVFTNQTKEWKKQHILNSLSTLNIPMTIVIAYDLAEHKPNPSMFHAAMDGKKFKPESSFFVGDALGRKGDFADTDRGFADNIGVKVLAPEDVFPLEGDEGGKFLSPEEAQKLVKPSSSQEIVVMAGYPGSGKSTIAKHLGDHGYAVVDGDVYKTDANRLKVGRAALVEGKSVVFDATNLTKEKRSIYVRLANELVLPVRCVYVSASVTRAMEQNMKRPKEKQVPRVAYYKMQKTFEEPTEDEGFKLVVV